VNRRVTFVLPSLHGGGAERAAVILLNGLAERGDRATLFLFAREGAYFEHLRRDVRVVAAGAGRFGRIAALRRFLAREPQDVVVSFLSHFTTFGAVRMAGTRARYVISQQTPLSAFLDDRDYRWRQPLRRRVFTAMTRSVYPRVDAIAATSQGVADDLAVAFDVPRAKLSVIPNPVDVEAVERAAEEPLESRFASAGVPTIVTAGRLAHAKNLPLLVQSLEQLSRTVAYRAWILGTGELEGDLRAMLAQSPVKDRVALLGFQPNPWKFMARADLFLLTSRYEGFGNVLIEAMAAGLPVVATASYGTRDIVEHDVTGLLVERHEPDAVAAAVERLLTEPQTRARLAAAARARASRFALPSVVDRFDALLDSLTSR
jgi:glycosyltransferase involved in cell wall biosynthesis